MAFCGNCGSKVSDDTRFCEQCGSPVGEAPTAPTPAGAAAPAAAEGDATGGLIPYKNMPALIAYYLGLFAIIPGLGLILGPIAFILGLMGLSKRKQHPEVKGTAHAWVGIICGLLFTIIWGGMIVFIFVAPR